MQYYTVSHPDQCKFVQMQWQKWSRSTKIYYLVYRIIMAVFYTSMFVSSFWFGSDTNTTLKRKLIWITYYSHWTIVVCSVQFYVGSALIVWSYRNHEIHDLPSIYKFYWTTHTLAVDMAFLIEFVHCLHPRELIIGYNYFNVIVLNDVVAPGMLLDLLMVAHPFRIWHFYMPMLLTAIYFIFNAICYAYGIARTDKDILSYENLDWSMPQKTMAQCTICMALIPVIHTVAFLIFKVRRWVHSKTGLGKRSRFTHKSLTNIQVTHWS